MTRKNQDEQSDREEGECRKLNAHDAGKQAEEARRNPELWCEALRINV